MNNYTQNNNSGDNIMNIGNQQRVLTDSLKEQLVAGIDNVEKICVTSVMGDGEAFQFATQIKDFLLENGHSVDGVDQAIYTQPITGQILENKDNKINIIIGKQE